MKKITFVIPSLTGGGAERVVSILANQFAETGRYEVRIVLLEDEQVDYHMDPRIRITYIRKPSGPRWVHLFYRILKLRNVFRDTDIIISFMWHMNMYTLFTSLGLGKEVIVSDRNDPRREVGQIPEFIQTLRKQLYKKADCVVFQTADAKVFYGKKVQKHSVIIANPINPELPPANPGQREKTILAAGRLVPQKNMEMAIRGFSKFAHNHPDYVLKIFGDGPLRPKLEELAADLGVSDRVVIRGFTSHIYDEMAKAGMYISTSDFEGISNSMLESMAMGMPSIVTDCPVYGARMFIHNRENGILIPVGDADSLAHAMADVADHPAEAEKLARNAVLLRNTLSAEKILQQWEAVLKTHGQK